MSRTLENIEGYLFPEYSKRKLRTLSQTYTDLARLYRAIPVEHPAPVRRGDLLYRRQVTDSKLVLASHLEELSDAVDEVAQTVVHVSVPTEHKRKQLIQYLRKQGIVVREMVFLEDGGRRRLSLVARLGLRKSLDADELADLLSVYLDQRLVPSSDSARTLGRSFDTYLFEDEPHYTMLSAMSRAIKEDERISGDNYSAWECGEGSVVLMIADGMGSGEQACEDSRSVIEFMEKFLEAGFQKEKAFTMMNSAIASQTQCCNLTTLDVCALDLHNGEAEFLKAGAAPSYRKRGTQVDEIGCDTLPLGSLSQITPMTQTISLMDSDMLILLSDGVSDCFETEDGRNRLRDVIAGYHTVNPKDMSDYLLRYAINCQGGRIRDDMTILVAGIWAMN